MVVEQLFLSPDLRFQKLACMNRRSLPGRCGPATFLVPVEIRSAQGCRVLQQDSKSGMADLRLLIYLRTAPAPAMSRGICTATATERDARRRDARPISPC